MNPPPRKRTKIIATLGPASDREEVLRAMIEAGMNLVRINFSHARPDALRQTLERIRSAADSVGVPIGILGDLRGPRIRVGEMTGGAITLEAGKDIVLTPDPCVGLPDRIGTTFPELAGDVERGTVLLLDDGNLVLRVAEVRGADVSAHIERGGMLSSNRGINLPGRRVNLPSITAKDEADLDFAVAEGFDFLAQSFVQSADDVRGLQAKIEARGARIPVIAKIEKKSALDDIEAIARTAYGVMVARGDLALEMSLPEVPIAQKMIIATCRQAASPVITATQMLESMTHAPKPTRAEATDVANAIFDGTDAVMLSGESAMGEYPVQTVAMMSAIAARAEAAWLGGELPGPPRLRESTETGACVARAAEELAMNVGARAILTHTTGGTTTRRVACHRPRMPILALSPDEGVRRRLALIWGVESERSEEIRGTAHMVELALRAAVERCGARAGDTVVIVAGTPYRVSGRTNLIKVETIPAAGEPVPTDT
jgi:pyruvate kinase